MTDNFYEGKTVVVTGSGGMIGSYLCRLLLDAGAHVWGLDNGSRGQQVTDGVLNLKPGDVTNLDWTTNVLSGLGSGKPVDAVFNLAATVAGVLHNQDNNAAMFQANMPVLCVPVVAAEKAGVPRYLNCSSVCIYSPSHNAPALEANGMLGEPIGANYGYGWAKRMSEKMAAISKIPHVVSVRPSNCEGRGTYYDKLAHVIPALVQKAIEDNAIQVYGHPDTTREFIHAEDVARGMMVALAKGENRGVYNLGTHGATCVALSDLVALIQRLNHTEDKRVIWHTDTDGGDPNRWSDCSRAHALGWQAQHDLERIVADVVEYYPTWKKSQA